jgi:hypothetical protein
VRQQEEQATDAKQEQTTTTEQDNGITVKPQPVISSPPQQSDQDAVKATEKLTLYLHPSQRDKLDELIMGYKKQTGKRVTHNKLMRILINQADLASLVSLNQTVKE